MTSMWYENAIFYGIDIRRFQDSNNDGFGDLQGLISRLDYLADLGCDALWLLPFFDSPLRDNGYDVRDYYQIDPRVGKLEDFTELVQEARKRNIRLVIDLVMNHTSDQHPWFQAARCDPESRYRNYYIWTDSPPKKSAGAPVFPGEEGSVWTHESRANSYYFHRFYHFQPDLRVANPDVQAEIFKIIDFWLSLGVAGFRFDAAPLMIEPKGFPGTEPDQPHKIFEEIYRYISQRNPETVLLAEADVPPDQADEFFAGESEMNMLFNFLIGPHIFLALALGKAEPLYAYFKNLVFPPAHDQWLIFLRNLDELNIAKMAPDHKKVLYDTYAPETNMRIYGRGIRRRLAPMLSKPGSGIDYQKLELAFSLLFSSPGAPLIMYGDEIGLGENLELTGRDAARTAMQWSKDKNAGFSAKDNLIAPVVRGGPFGYETINVCDQLSDTGSLLHYVKNLIAIRKKCPEIGLYPVRVLEQEEDDQRVIVSGYPTVSDDSENVSLLLFHNLSAHALSTTLSFPHASDDSLDVLFGNGRILPSQQENLVIELPPYGYLWVRAQEGYALPERRGPDPGL
jgi:maltose alpha-D-glucosyltransferase / alpha-amylase